MPKMEKVNLDYSESDVEVEDCALEDSLNYQNNHVHQMSRLFDEFRKNKYKNPFLPDIIRINDSFFDVERHRSIEDFCPAINNDPIKKEKARLKLEAKIAEFANTIQNFYSAYGEEKENSRLKLEAKIAGSKKLSLNSNSGNELVPTMISMHGLWLLYGDSSYHNNRFPELILKKEDFSNFIESGFAKVLDYNPVNPEMIIMHLSKKNDLQKNKSAKKYTNNPVREIRQSLEIYKFVDTRVTYYTEDGIKID